MREPCLPCGPTGVFVTESSASLCTGAESNLGDRVLGEVEKESFIALPGKGGHAGFCLEKLCVSPARGFDEGLYGSGSKGGGGGSLTRLGCGEQGLHSLNLISGGRLPIF